VSQGVKLNSPTLLLLRLDDDDDDGKNKKGI
jgi:hypothetical protein